MSGLVAKSGCRWDIVSLGEVMLRLDPGEGRVSTTRHFQVWEGGGEYNVARGLKRCFGLGAAVVTAPGGHRRRRSGPGPDLPGRRPRSALEVGEVRRRRTYSSQRSQLYRARFWRARRC